MPGPSVVEPGAVGAVASTSAAPTPPGSPTLRAALDELDRSRSRTYYDAAADSAAAAQYYACVRTDELGGLLAGTHRSPRRYSPATELYPWVDLQPDGSLRSLYTDHRWDPADLIAEDIRTAERRLEGLARHVAAGAAADDALADALEEQLPYNCEHVVPQSWFGKREPMRGDLHHLFACESRCNGFRANTPFTEYADFPVEEAVRHGCGKSEPAGFEPAFGKGAAARAVLYFGLRYPGTVEERLGPDRLRVLLAWHEREPVTDWERHRNAAIFDRQGNRNPMVDRPEWAPEVVALLAPASG